MIRAGDNVRVYPHGSPEEAAIGKVLLAGSHAIGIAFGDRPSFISSRPGILFHPDEGVTFFAYRYDVGPWIEMMGEGHYEIETAEIIEEGKAIHCFRCGMVSHNPNDVANPYCGQCHRFHEPTAIGGLEHWV